VSSGRVKSVCMKSLPTRRIEGRGLQEKIPVTKKRGLPQAIICSNRDETTAARREKAEIERTSKTTVYRERRGKNLTASANALSLTPDQEVDPRNKEGRSESKKNMNEGLEEIGTQIPESSGYEQRPL